MDCSPRIERSFQYGVLHPFPRRSVENGLNLAVQRAAERSAYLREKPVVVQIVDLS